MYYFALFLTFTAVLTTDNCKLQNSICCCNTAIKNTIKKKAEKVPFQAGIMTLPKTFIGSYFVLVVWHRQLHIGKGGRDWISFLLKLQEVVKVDSIEFRYKSWNFATSDAIGQKNFSNLRTGAIAVVVVVESKDSRLILFALHLALALSQGWRLSIIQWCRAFACEQKEGDCCNFCHYLQRPKKPCFGCMFVWHLIPFFPVSNGRRTFD